jgi:TolB-like protein/DNA-binding winged helix-turn-helix (wHTH) protein/Tfp pilus assembly protein PilF
VPSEPARIVDGVKFGDGFELDFAASRLSRSGRVLKLERIPMEVLLLLVQKRGQPVTREQIAEKIWGKDVHLDTDNSINGAVRKIRQVLKDDSEQPRFIQTITGQGYRFIAPVVEAVTEAPREPAPALSVLPGPLQPGAGVAPRWTATLVLTGVAGVVIILVAVVLSLRWSQSQARAPRSGERTMLAVLPFENLTGDASQSYFSDGMTEEMITQLGSLDPHGLGVIARTSVMHYKNSQESLAQIGRELGVQYVLEGSVRRDANHVRITAQLIEMKDQTHMWARQYDRELKDLLVLQSEIAREISDEIQTSLGERKAVVSPRQSQSQAAPLPTLSPQAYEAYNLYLKGLYFWNRRSVDGFQQAISYFQQATEKDPTYARAFVGLADSYALIGGYSGAPSGEYMDKARAAALRALQLDDSLPEAHAALALIVQNHDYDWQTAEKEFKRAIELNPNDATAHHWYAEHLTWRGRFDEALAESERARQLDPLSLIIAADNGAILYYSRQYDRAIAQFKAVRELDPYFPRSGLITDAYIQKGMFAEALAETQKHFLDESAWHYSNEAFIAGRAGRQQEADAALRKLLELNRRQPMDPIVIVQAYLGTRDKDQTIAWLEKAYAQHSNGLTALKVDPAYDPLRSDPRFQNLLARLGLAA